MQAAGEFVNLLQGAIHDQPMSSHTRGRAAGACLAVAQDHHHAIVLLIDHQLFASAFALMRIAFEAYIRGEWLAQCASDEQVSNIVGGMEPPKIDDLLAALEKIPTFSEGRLSEIKKHNWRSMCAYTHTGSLQIQRWQTPDTLESNYSDEEVLEVLSFAEIIGAVSIVGLAALAEKEQIAVDVGAALNAHVAKWNAKTPKAV